VIALVALGAMFVDGFLSRDNAVQVLQSQAFVGIVAVGMTWVVLSGNFVDLSVPVTMAVAANACLGLLDRNVTLALAVALGVPILIGFANGFIVSVAGANPVIATLGVATVVGGILLMETNGAFMSSDGTGFQEAVGDRRVLGIPLPVIVFLGLLILGQGVLSLSRFGALVRLTGANRSAARANGVPVNAVVVTCFVICAFCAALGGVLLGAFTNQADLTTGQGYEFDALAAVVIGGTSLFGGIGSFWRTFVGVLVIGVANNLMLLLGFDTSVQLFVKGSILIAAVSLDAVAAWGQRQ
jgi:ribose/xylose/arabinose/galactoside ABC-type transport system permease subunit